MKKCSKCYEIKNDFPKGKICRECRNRINREKSVKKSKKYCPICNTQHIKVAKECSVKCMLMNRYEINNDCWGFTGKISKNGYGHLISAQSGRKKHYSAHRESYRIFKGDIPDGLNVCHHCDNRKCINPNHLFIGTPKENMQDALTKGRLKKTTGYKHTEETKKLFKYRKHSDRKGVKHHLCKLSENDIREIRKLLTTKTKRKDIALKYGINVTYLTYIKNGKAWPHLK